MKNKTFLALWVTLGLCTGLASAKGQDHHRNHNRNTDKNGTISLEEFIAKAKARFDAIDTDHNGQIDKAERKAMHQKHHGAAAKGHGKHDKPAKNAKHKKQGQHRKGSRN